MFASTLTAVRPPSPVVASPGQLRKPVGARFPRTWPVAAIHPDTQVSRPERKRALVFPVGCRYPRRTVADGLAYLAAAVPTAPSAAARPLMPSVGARFPRRPRSTMIENVAAPATPALTEA